MAIATPPLRYDCVIIGGGHNGLICAATLARGGRSVLVLEAAAQVGGAAVTREFAPGFRVSAGAHLLHLMPAELLRELKLESHGLEWAAQGMATTAMLPGGARLTLGMLQELVTNQGDGWTWSLEELRLYYEARAVEPAPPTIIEASKRPILALSEEPLPEVVTASMGLYLEAVATLGQRTAEMHLALAAESDNPAFRPQPLDKNDLSLLTHQFRERANDALDGLKTRLATLPDDLVELVGLLLARRRQVLDAFRRLEETDAVVQKIRIHGDFHLGQVLRARGDFVVLDFEGEPARSPEERRAMQSPLKDVAGMVRSFSYAAHAALASYLARRPQDADTLEPWARLWSKSASAAFLASYRTVAAGAAFLPANSSIFARLLDAFLVDKAFYELGYELDHRPTWARIPLLGILALVREPVGER